MQARLAVSLALIAVLALPEGAAADHPRSTDAGERKHAFDQEAVPERIQRALGGEVTATPDGGFKVDVSRGPDLFTHGPDPVPANAMDGSAGGAQGVPGTIDPYGTGGLTDPPLCVGDPNGDYYQHVLYGRPQGTTSRLEQFRSSFVDALFQMNYVLDRDSEASGGPGADYKFLCNQDLTLRIDSFVNQGAANFADVTSAARAAGFNKQNVDYTIFYDGDPAVPQCGVGGFFFDEDPTATNINNLGNAHAITWVDCWFNNTPMHENGHNQGAVQYDAPHSTGSGAHCWEEIDVMCYSPDGGDKHQEGTVLVCNGLQRFDCGADDYFDSAVEGNEAYLDDHWNIGSAVNRFIVLGAGGGDTDPTAAFTYSCPDLTCQFTDQSSEGDSAIETWHWNFGEGALASSQQNPTYTYNSSGTYNVSLLVEDEEGDSDVVELPVTVSDGTPPRLLNAVREDRSSGVQGTYDRYTFRVPKNRRKLVLQISGEECEFVGEELCVPDLDLYGDRVAPPEVRPTACRPFLYGINERCTIRNPRKGTWHIAVHSYAAPPGTDYSIKATHRR